MNITLVGFGAACVVGAIVGGGLEMAGVKLPYVDSPRRQALLGIMGLGFLILGLVNPGADSKANDRGAGPVPTSPSVLTIPPTPLTTTVSTTVALPPDWTFRKNLDVALFDSFTSLDLGKGEVMCCQGAADLYYERVGNGVTQLRAPDRLTAYSTTIEGGESTKAKCQEAIASHPRTSVIRQFSVGQQICVRGPYTYGVALLEVLAVPAADGLLRLQETYWVD